MPIESSSFRWKWTAPFHPDVVEADLDDQRRLAIGRDVLALPYNVLKKSCPPGMYEFDEATGVREGGLVILDAGDGSVLSEMTGEDCTGILDLRWTGEDTLVACTAEGGLEFFTVSEDGRKIDCTSRLPVFHEEGAKGVAIGLDASKRGRRIATLATGGEVALVDGVRGEVVSSWQAHDPKMESWTCCLSPDESVLATGGDDCRMKLWDVRTPNTDAPIVLDRREHEAGITAYLFVDDGRRLLTGSYDENVRVWDLRYGVADQTCDTSSMQCVVRQAAIGGVWRMKRSITGKDLLIAGCYGGCEVWRLDDLLHGREAERIGEYTGHESMAYGITSVSKTGGVVSCSFYDNAVHRWSYQ
ncbi:Diphthine methyltransferase [Perkinsus chesapeaki]|uniref:methylated diphthine methylhydrolase n=1 Tax=Perkinsus chesapeaki TaxID=330153 RepID=A0A7J6MN05_PERCH|nr:Diphthine methyltransferase [Perkinsus chesapeaki]